MEFSFIDIRELETLDVSSFESLVAIGGDGTVKWQAARGFVITPLDTHIVSAIVGLYFGAGFTK